MQNRRRSRLGLKVIHRHRAGRFESRRVSELIFVRGRPRAVLGWIDVGGMRAPVLHVDLDPDKLREACGRNGTYYYEGVTIDPRYEEVQPARPREHYPGQERRKARTPYTGMERRRTS